jgi:hypothetical protein
MLAVNGAREAKKGARRVEADLVVERTGKEEIPKSQSALQL